MKMKKFFSVILAAVMSITVIAAPVSAAAGGDDTPPKGKIIINHAAPSGTYTAYPVFTGDVEKSDDAETQGKMVIDSPKFHPNLETTITAGAVAARGGGSNDYGLWKFVSSNSYNVNGTNFLNIIKDYDPHTAFTVFSGIGGASGSPGTQADAIANLLNLTANNNSVSTILNGKATSAFYSAFAESARMFMIDKIADAPGTLADIASATPSDGTAVITVDKPGYYLVEYSPADSYTEEVPRAVRRALVLVGLGDDLAATINSKDTQNIASVDIQFNETMLIKNDADGTFSYLGNTEGNWAKNVSAGNSDYVNCRVVVTLPGNFSAYDQYYLAVPLMYGYNASGSIFDSQKSITRVKGSDDNPLQNIKFYFLSQNGESVAKVIKDPALPWSTDNLTDSVSEIFGDSNGHNATFEIKDNTYTYANDEKGTNEDKFAAAETFVIKDIANMIVRDNPAGGKGPTLKERFASDEGSSWNKLVIEFPVKFERFSTTGLLNTGASSGIQNPGYNSVGQYTYDYAGDDALLKNYISARAVYSNNPNLEALKAGETAYDKTNNPDGVKLYLDTSKEPGTLQNPLGVTKTVSSANIVTYRLRVHSTTNDYKDVLAGGLEGVYFALKNSEGKYAIVKMIGSEMKSYDQVSDDEGFLDPSFGNAQRVRLYIVTGWEDVTDLETNYKTDTTHILQTSKGLDSYNETKSSNNGGRFEILGLAPGTYTVVALESSIKAKEQIGTSGNAKDYKLPKEDGNPKTDYKFSFAPTLVKDCNKLPYNVHYAPVGSSNPANSSHGIIADTDKLIENFNLKWLKGDEEIADKPKWWIGQRDDVALMSMRVTYIKKGLTLPVTGGIGTFIFFTVGGALVVISTVVIVTRARIKRERL